MIYGILCRRIVSLLFFWFFRFLVLVIFYLNFFLLVCFVEVWNFFIDFYEFFFIQFYEKEKLLYDFKKELEKKQKKNKDLLNDQESLDLLVLKREFIIKDFVEWVLQLELFFEKEYFENLELKVFVEEKEMCLQQ